MQLAALRQTGEPNFHGELVPPAVPWRRMGRTHGSRPGCSLAPLTNLVAGKEEPGA